MIRSFKDGIISLTQKLTNRRNAHATNRISSQRVDWEELRAIYKTGVGSKIIRLKSGIALNDTLQFESEADKDFYEQFLQKHIKKSTKFMLAFGRGLIVPHEPNADLSQPIGKIQDWSKVRYHVFSGDMVYIGRVNFDLASPEYFQPEMYHVRAAAIHPRRCIDFRYVEPVEHDAPEYNFGGISEFELIRNELISDGIVQRAVPGILERASTLFYKIEGFKDLLADRKEQDLLTYLAALEDTRSIYGAGVVDKDDEITNITQQLANLADADQITLRRLAMVTGLPLSWLVGEAARGLNSTGEGERQVLQQTIETLQSEYLLEPINAMMRMHGKGPASFKENQGEDPKDRVLFEKEALQNALILYQLGEDHVKYLEDKGLIVPDSWDRVFADPEPEFEPDHDLNLNFGDFDESKVKREGGKFAKKEGAGGGEKEESKSKKAESGIERHSGASSKETKEALSKVSSPPPKNAHNYIKASVEKMSKKGYTVHTRTGEDGEINAAVAWEKSKDKKSVFVETLGSMGAGGGKQMLNEVIKESEKLGFGGAITLFPVRDPDTINFYMKFETEDGRYFDAHPSGNGQWLLPAKK